MGIGAYFGARVHGEDAAPAREPDPRGALLGAMVGLGVSAPARCVYVGDATADMARPVGCAQLCAPCARAG